ncbi:putative membrane protein [Streptococcus sanguinis]|nr:putative membrane protein [Streptococcus sanguinis]
MDDFVDMLIFSIVFLMISLAIVTVIDPNFTIGLLNKLFQFFE